MKINKNSWHYEIYKFSRDRGYEDKSDICTYTRGFIVSILLALLVSVLLSTVISVVISPIISLAAYYLTDNGWIWILNEVSEIGLLLWVAAILAGIVYSVIWAFKRTNKAIKKSKAVNESDTVKLVKTSYRAFKEKTCILIEFE